MIRLRGTGPRSLTRTKIAFMLLRLVTRTQLPRGRLRWAQVRAFMLKRSPDAVLRPLKSFPYQEALPICIRGCFGEVAGLESALGSVLAIPEPVMPSARAMSPRRQLRVAVVRGRLGFCMFVFMSLLSLFRRS